MSVAHLNDHEIWLDMSQRVAELLSPAIDTNTPYAKVMVGAIVDLFMSKLEAERGKLMSAETDAEMEGIASWRNPLPKP